MLHDIIDAKYIKGYKIELKFDDGKRGIVDFSKYLDKGGIFDQFKDIGFFRNFSINKDLGTLTWDGKVDIAPETLYAEATGSALPVWMEHSDDSSGAKPVSSKLQNAARY